MTVGSGPLLVMAGRLPGHPRFTNDLLRRVWEHQEGIGSSFVRRYGLAKLGYCERREDIRTAIQRKYSLRRWPRAWKVRLFVAQNLYPMLRG